MITQEELKILVNYDPETGIFKIRDDYVPPQYHNGRLWAGKVLGWESGLPNEKYLCVSLNKKSYLLHRLAFLYMEGRMPAYVDHINGGRLDNRWSNLRECTNQQNISNQKTIRSVLGLKGVTRNKKRFAAQIMFNYKKIHIGTFDTPEEAHAAYVAKANELYGDIANPGKVHRIAKGRTP